MRLALIIDVLYGSIDWWEPNCSGSEPRKGFGISPNERVTWEWRLYRDPLSNPVLARRALECTIPLVSFMQWIYEGVLQAVQCSALHVWQFILLQFFWDVKCMPPLMLWHGWCTFFGARGLNLACNIYIYALFLMHHHKLFSPSLPHPSHVQFHMGTAVWTYSVVWFICTYSLALGCGWRKSLLLSALLSRHRFRLGNLFWMWCITVCICHVCLSKSMYILFILCSLSWYLDNYKNKWN